MRDFVQRRCDHVVRAIWDIAIQTQIPRCVFSKSDNHVMCVGVQICAGELIGKGHRVLPIQKWRTLKVVHDFQHFCFGQHIGREGIPLDQNGDWDH